MGQVQALYIGDILEEMNHSQQLNHKELEKKRGFFIYESRTYPALVPFLKGTHQTLEMLRQNRDEDKKKTGIPILSTPLQSSPLRLWVKSMQRLS
jgi:hypothetical protein